jgi:hypothetical protein
MRDMDNTQTKWPTVIISEDLYVPDTAASLLRALCNLDDESARANLKCHAMDAEGEVTSS